MWKESNDELGNRVKLEALNFDLIKRGNSKQKISALVLTFLETDDLASVLGAPPKISMARTW